MMNNKFVCVSGFFSSGSSAVVDLLKEFKNADECGAEIRIIKDPHGLVDLEDALVNKWELINSSAAIDEFIDLCKKCARSGGRNPFEPAGLGYTKKLNPDFMSITYDYINRLTQFEYTAEYYYYKFRKHYFKYITDRWRWAIEYLSKGKYKTANRNIKPIHFSKPTQEEFLSATKEYLDSLFVNKTQSDEGFIILDQAISPNNPNVIDRYFDNCKLIVVSRDPRDMYIDNVLWGVSIDRDRVTREAGYRYAIQQKALRSVRVNNDDVLYVNFEDLVQQYDSTVPVITSFLGLSEADHVNKNVYLKPERSSKNVGIWKKYYEEYKDAIDAIYEELKEYCHE